MKRFIFGFQRLVWCPKWTPASSSWRMVTTATVVLPAVPVRPPPVVLPTVVDRVGGPGPRPARVPPGAGTVESRRRACVVARTPGPAPDDSTSPPTPALARPAHPASPRPIRGPAAHQVPAAAPAAAAGSSRGPRVTSTPGATWRLTQLVPATGPANATLPAAGARTSSPTEAAMSIPRCPGPYGPARASKPRTTAPATGIHNGGTGGGARAVGGGGEGPPAPAARAAAGKAHP